MALEVFSAEYRTLKEIVSKGQFDEPLKAAMGQMGNIFGTDGFDPDCEAPLEQMRGLLFVQEHDRILSSAGIDPKATTAPPLESVMRAAALKFLRHLYLVHRRGSQKVWVADTPKSYRHYPSGELDSVKSSMLNLRARLGEKDEQFGPHSTARRCRTAPCGRSRSCTRSRTSTAAPRTIATTNRA